MLHQVGVSFDLFRPRLILSSKVFQVVFVHLGYNPALLSASCCCSSLLHVVANLICIFLDTRQKYPVIINFIKIYIIVTQFINVDALTSNIFQHYTRSLFDLPQNKKKKTHIRITGLIVFQDLNSHIQTPFVQRWEGFQLNAFRSLRSVTE